MRSSLEGGPVRGPVRRRPARACPVSGWSRTARAREEGDEAGARRTHLWRRRPEGGTEARGDREPVTSGIPFPRRVTVTVTFARARPGRARAGVAQALRRGSFTDRRRGRPRLGGPDRGRVRFRDPRAAAGARDRKSVV